MRSIPLTRCSSVWRISLVLALIAGLTVGRGQAAPGPRPIPRPLPSHPGNIFLTSEPVVLPEPPGLSNAWRVVDYDGKTILHGQFKEGLAEVGALPVGCYKLVRGGRGYGTNRCYFGVVKPLHAPTPLDSPIGIDVALAWCCPQEHWADMISLCQLAGMNRVRDRASWPEIEPQPGQFAAHTRYDDTTRLQTDAGLQVLDVNHIAPAWSGTNAGHFPADLRVVHDFYQRLAARWHGKIEALEPWNEADLKEFGGHTGSEMATFQKAAFLGMRAGDPTLT